MSALKLFLKKMAEKKDPHVLELGTRRADPNIGTIRRDWIPNAKKYVGVDFQTGPDVDVVADVHLLSNVFGENRFDAILSLFAYEHIQYPWIATLEICRALKPGGLAYINTVQAYPLHSYPYDYWRFSIDGLKTLFSEQAGFKTIFANYEYPCRVLSVQQPHSEYFEAYLYVNILAEKIAHPPQGFMYKPILSKHGAEETLSSDAVICINPEEALDEMNILPKEYTEEDRYKRLRRNWFFGIFISLGNRLINYPFELNILPQTPIKIDRYYRLKKNWFFGPIVRLGDRILNLPREKRENKSLP